MRRLSEGWVLFAGLAAAAYVLILGLASKLSFYGDEWSYIVDRRLTLDGLLQPHNEHLAALHVLVYRGMVEAIGIGSYTPYLVVLLTLHVGTAAALLVLLSGHLPRSGALAASILFLFLGTGFDNLLWAFQIGFVGAVFFGIWSLVLADRPWLAATLLTAAVWTQSDGLFYLAPAAILMRRRLPLIVPVGSYVAWLLLVGRQAIAPPAPGPYLEYLVTAVGSAFGGVTGLGLPLGVLVVLAVCVGLIADILRSRRIEPIVFAGLAGLASEYVILAIGRASFGLQQAEAPRYIYVAVPFILMLLPAFRWVPGQAWAIGFCVALILNVSALPRGVAIYNYYLNYDRSLTMEERLAPWR